MIKKDYKYLMLTVLVMVFTGCAQQPIELNKDIAIKNLDICVSYAEDLDKDTVILFKDAVDQFFQERKQRRASFSITKCIGQQSSGLQVEVYKNQTVGPVKQGVATVVTTLGLTIPFFTSSPIIVAYIPRAWSKVVLLPSSDLARVGSERVERTFYIWPYYLSIEEQRRRQSEKFKEFLHGVIDEVESKL